MPKLQMNSAPCLMYRIRDPAPASDLLVRIDAGSKCITFALPGDLGCLTDNQPRTSPLPIVFSIHFIWSIAWLGEAELSGLRKGGRQGLVGVETQDYEFPLEGVAAAIHQLDECRKKRGLGG